MRRANSCQNPLMIVLRVRGSTSNLMAAAVIAKKKILAREVEEKSVFKRLYKLDNPFDLQWIDLVVDVSNKTPEELGSDIITEMGL